MLLWELPPTTESPAFITALPLIAALSACDPALCIDPAALERGLASGQSPIVGGSIDDTSRATVALLFSFPDGGRGLCSGTVIAKNGSQAFVLTAAHCAQGHFDDVYEAVDFRDCEPGGDSSKCLASYTPVSWQVHPGYDPETLANDFAVVTVEGASASTSVTPALAVDLSLAVDQTLLLSGYGRTYAGPDDENAATNSVRHKVDVRLAQKTDKWLRIDATSGKTACFGDSGGPAYAHVGGALVVAGVASNADANCADVANYSRVALVYSDFIAPIIDAGETPGSGGAGGTGGAPPSQSGGGGAASEPPGGAAQGGANVADSGGGGSSADATTPPGDLCFSLQCGAAMEAQPSSAASQLGAGLLLALSLVRRRKPRSS